jgi:hypothetical protein
MEIIERNIHLCVCCTMASVNGDSCDCDGDCAAEVAAGLADLGEHIVPDFDSESGDGIREFSSVTCAGCHTWLAGSRHRFARLAA